RVPPGGPVEAPLGRAPACVAFIGWRRAPDPIMVVPKLSLPLSRNGEKPRVLHLSVYPGPGAPLDKKKGAPQSVRPPSTGSRLLCPWRGRPGANPFPPPVAPPGVAQAALRRPENAAGDLFVDSSCIDCDTCRWMAPATFARAGRM